MLPLSNYIYQLIIAYILFRHYILVTKKGVVHSMEVGKANNPSLNLRYKIINYKSILIKDGRGGADMAEGILDKFCDKDFLLLLLLFILLASNVTTGRENNFFFIIILAIIAFGGVSSVFGF
jgi:hypothetical protein